MAKEKTPTTSTSTDLSEIDMRLKTLGKFGDIPQICPLCQKRMADLGWAVSLDQVLCYACKNSFRIILRP